MEALLLHVVAVAVAGRLAPSVRHIKARSRVGKRPMIGLVLVMARAAHHR